jgi:hypothetical protein
MEARERRRAVAKCAKCEGEMEQVQVGNVTVDSCPSCGGIWFDLSELVSVARLGKGGQEQLAECLLAEGPEGGNWGQDPAFCPRCAAALKPSRFDQDLPVILDYCPEGHGAWLDKGEFAEVNRFYDELYNKLFPGRKDLTREEARAQVESNERLLDAMDIVGKVGCAAIATAGAYLAYSAGGTIPTHIYPGAVACGAPRARNRRLKWSS